MKYIVKYEQYKIGRHYCGTYGTKGSCDVKRK